MSTAKTPQKVAPDPAFAACVLMPVPRLCGSEDGIQGECSCKLSSWAHGLESELGERADASRAKGVFHSELGGYVPTDTMMPSSST